MHSFLQNLRQCELFNQILRPCEIFLSKSTKLEFFQNKNWHFLKNFSRTVLYCISFNSKSDTLQNFYFRVRIVATVPYQNLIRYFFYKIKIMFLEKERKMQSISCSLSIWRNRVIYWLHSLQNKKRSKNLIQKLTRCKLFLSKSDKLHKL